MRSKTYLIDIDGTIFEKHGDTASEQWGDTVHLVPGAREFINKVEKESACIILCTARKESHRFETERQLRYFSIPYDQLVMGLTNGERVLVNDGPSSLMMVNSYETRISTGSWCCDPLQP